jgi:hypothetical protein
MICRTSSADSVQFPSCFVLLLLQLTTAERRRLAHSSKQRVRDSVSQHYANELSHKAAIHKRQTAAAAAAAKLAEQHLQKLADRRQRQMEELCTQSRQQSMRLPSIAELEQIEGQWLIPQQGGGQPWPLLQQQQQQQRAMSGQYAARRQQQQQLDRRGSGMTRVAGQRAVRGSLRSGSIAGSSKLERVLSGDEVAEVVNAAAAAEELAPCNGDVVIHIPDASSNSSGSEIEPLAMQQQQQQQRGPQLRCIVTGVDSSTSELQQPLLPPVVESPFAAPQQQLRQQQQGFWGLQDIPENQQQQPEDSQYEPPSVLVLAAAKLQQQLEEQQQQQASDVAFTMTSSSSGSGIWTFNFSQNRAAAAAAAAASAELPTPGFASQQLQDHSAPAPAGDQECLQHSGSQLLLQRYLDASGPAAHIDTDAAAAAAGVVVASSVPLQLSPVRDTQGEQQQQQQQQCCDLMLVESEPSSECATATSSTADHYSSCCGGCQSDSVCQTDSVCDVVQSPVAVAVGKSVAKATAGATAAPADVSAQCDMFV